jgi:hypothetical protein
MGSKSRPSSVSAYARNAVLVHDENPGKTRNENQPGSGFPCAISHWENASEQQLLGLLQIPATSSTNHHANAWESSLIYNLPDCYCPVPQGAGDEVIPGITF